MPRPSHIFHTRIYRQVLLKFVELNTLMKNRIVYLLTISFFLILLNSCAERRYYKTHNDHSERYYRHHPKKHVEVDIKVRP